MEMELFQEVLDFEFSLSRGDNNDTNYYNWEHNHHRNNKCGGIRNVSEE